MKFATLFTLLLSVVTLIGQTDSSTNFENKWNKFKEKAKAKTEEIKTNWETASENSATNKKAVEDEAKKPKIKTAFGTNQHIDAKKFTEGSREAYYSFEDQWKPSDRKCETKVTLADNGDVRHIEVDDNDYEMSHEFESGEPIYMNTHFYSSKNRRYGICIDDCMVEFYFSKNSSGELEVESIGSVGKPSISPEKVKVMLVEHWAFIKENKKKLLGEQYEYVSSFQENRFRTVRNKEQKYGIVNPQGEVVSEVIYDKITDFSDGYCWASEEGKWILFDETGKIVDKTGYDAIGEFYNGKASITKGSKLGFLTTDLKQDWLFTNGEYDLLLDFDEVFLVKKGEYSGLVSSSGETILECEYKIKHNCANTEKMLLIQGKDKLFGYYKIGYGWLTERIYNNADYRHNCDVAKETIDYEEYKLQIFEPYSTISTIRGRLFADGSVEWGGERTPPNKNPTMEKLPWREQYSTSHRVLNDRPIIATVNDGKKYNKIYGMIDHDGKVVVDIQYQSIKEEDYPNYLLYISQTSRIDKFFRYNHETGKYSDTLTFERSLFTDAELEATTEYGLAQSSSYSGSGSYSSSTSSSGSSSSSSSSSSSNSSESQFSGSVKILNNTGTKYHYQWKGYSSGSGYVNNGSSVTTSCKKGSKFYVSISNKSSDNEFVLELTPEMCGKTIKLSDYL